MITRTVYASSELKTRSFLAESLAVCELVGLAQEWLPSLRGLYKVATLHGIKSDREDSLCRRTNERADASFSSVCF